MTSFLRLMNFPRPTESGTWWLQQDLNRPQWVRYIAQGTEPDAGSWYPLDRHGEPYKHSSYDMIACGWHTMPVNSEEAAAAFESFPTQP